MIISDKTTTHTTARLGNSTEPGYLTKFRQEYLVDHQEQIPQKFKSVKYCKKASFKLQNTNFFTET